MVQYYYVNAGTTDSYATGSSRISSYSTPVADKYHIGIAIKRFLASQAFRSESVEMQNTTSEKWSRFLTTKKTKWEVNAAVDIQSSLS
jgi:hypothetical protein